MGDVKFRPSGLISEKKEPSPATSVLMTSRVDVSITETVRDTELDTNASVPSSVMITSHALIPIVIVSITVSALKSMMETVPSRMLST